MRGAVAQRLAQPANGGVQVVLEIDEDIVGPEPPLEVLACDHLPGVFDERRQYLEGLLAEPDPHPALEELTGRQIEVEAVEADDGGHRRILGWRTVPLYARPPKKSTNPHRSHHR
jgi:hypothetical protein